MPKYAYLYVLDTMSDWETGYLIAELNTGRYFKKGTEKYNVKTLGITRKSITTMGGIQITPDVLVNELTIENTDLLILPGADTWFDTIHAPLLTKVKDLIEADICVAAICGATIALANAGLLDNHQHTSNDPGYLKSVCPNYRGEHYYKQEPAVTDGNLITASGIAPLEFACAVLKNLDVFSPQTLDSWYKLYLTKEAACFFSLMKSLNP